MDLSGAEDFAVAHGVAVLDGAGDDDGEDFHVVVRVLAEALAGRNVILIDNAECAEAHVGGVVITVEGEGMPGVEPAVIGVAALDGGTKFNHDLCAFCRGYVAMSTTRLDAKDTAAIQSAATSGAGGASESGKGECSNMAATKKSTTKKSAKKSTKKSTRKYGSAAGKSVEREMKSMKKGTLKSGGSGKKVTSRKQAIAIGLSEARKSGAKVPKKKSKS